MKRSIAAKIGSLAGADCAPVGQALAIEGATADAAAIDAVPRSECRDVFDIAVSPGCEDCTGQAKSAQSFCYCRFRS